MDSQKKKTLDTVLIVNQFAPKNKLNQLVPGQIVLEKNGSSLFYCTESGEVVEYNPKNKAPLVLSVAALLTSVASLGTLLAFLL